MTSRILVLLLVACACIVSPVRAQQAESGSRAFELELIAAGAKLDMDDEYIRVKEAADLPLPGQQGARIFADELAINRKTSVMVATGNVSFTTADSRINAERIEFNLDQATGVFYVAQGFMTVVGANRVEFGNQDPYVYFYGEKIEKLGPKHYVVTKGGFSTCVQPTPRWDLDSDRITLRLDD